MDILTDGAPSRNGTGQHGPRTLIFGSASPTLNAAVSREFAGHGASIVQVDDVDAHDGTIDRAVAELGGLDVVVNLYCPAPASDPADALAYPSRLLARCLAAAEAIVAHTDRGALVSHCFLPALYSGTRLDDAMPAVKGAITGLTRTLCRRFAQRGLRVNYVQTGLIDLPELKPGLSARGARSYRPDRTLGNRRGRRRADRVSRAGRSLYDGPGRAPRRRSDGRFDRDLTF